MMNVIALTRLRCLIVLGAGVIAGCATEPEYALEFSPEAPLSRIGAAPFRIGHPALVMSPDASTMVYVGGSETSSRLYRRTLANADAVPIAGTEGAYGPFFSPDGQRVAFFAGDRLKHASLDGGDVVDLVLVHQPMGGAWHDDGTILYADHECWGLYRIPSAGGTPAVVAHEAGCWPHLLPGGRTALVGRWGQLLVVDLATGAKTPFDVNTPHGLGVPRYVSTGHVLYTVAGRLMAMPFDAERLQVTGEPIAIVTDLRTEALNAAAHYVLTPPGDLLYVSGGHHGIGQFVWVGDDRTERPLDIEPAVYGEYRLDPAGTTLAYAVPDDRWRLRLHDLSTGRAVTLQTTGSAYWPAWTPDGRSVVFRMETDDGWAYVRAPGDGAAPPEQVRTADPFVSPQFFTRDAQTLIAARGSDTTLADVVALRLDAPEADRLLVATAAGEWGAVPSPDGQLIAYMTDEFGRYEVVVRAIAGGDAVRVSQGGGMDPLWSADGRTLYFQDVRRAMAATIETRPALRASEPTVLFEGAWVDIGGHGWDRAADGRFLIVRETDDSSAPVTLRVLSGWADLLNR